MVDEEQGQLNVLKSSNIDFSLCRFHLVRAWRKHIQKKVDVETRSSVADCLLQLLNTKNEEEYENSATKIFESLALSLHQFILL